MRAQYEAFPYPERDPADEAKRLITGSPSYPPEMDHWLWGGARDWSRPLRFLAAGGGTGDGLIQLAQMLTSAGRAYEATYLDLSQAARRIAEDRAAQRRLTRINFTTQSILNAAEYGPFDYIDCCGVLHHLPDPQAGFDALAGALAPGGGIGLMVYAPHGRSGVYPLQDAFAALTAGLAPQDRLARAQEVYQAIPEGHPFKRNPHLVDHNTSEAGFYDLLLHSSDRPYRISELLAALDRAGLELAGVPVPAEYDPEPLVGALPDTLGDAEKMQLSEDLRGTIKVHTVYAVKKGARVAPPKGHPEAIPHLRGLDPARLARAIAQKGSINASAGGKDIDIALPKSAAGIVAGVNGRRNLAALRQAAKMDPIAFGAAWGPVETALTGLGMLHYSRVLSA
ncbi:class I SAM-dependent methyltransferase [Candidatus Rhodobacter oscarellae]|nr:class I SAM-dependent methyltransferase [Candidatus Rhodobacter lobularis]